VSEIHKSITTINSYDLIKFFAVIIMITDHAGLYFFPDTEWFRAVGRIGFPIWFFLVGYARGREISKALLFGAIILTLYNFIAGMAVFSLNALVTIILIRLSLDMVMKIALKSVEALILVLTVLFALILPTDMFSEYGTQGLVLAMFGYVIRNKPSIKGLSANNLAFFMMLASAVIFVTAQQFYSWFTLMPFLFMAIGSTAVCCILYEFKPVDYPRLTRILGSAGAVVRFCGHRTLEIYVAHLLLFKSMAMILDPEEYSFLQWSWSTYFN
jgi:hypothetical protein